MDKASSAGLAAREEVKSRLGDGLDDVLLGNRAVNDALESLDGLLGDLGNRRSGTGDLDGEETSIGVGDVGSGRASARSRGSDLGQKAETRRPLDAGFTAKEAGEDSDLGLAGAEGSAGESNDDRVGALLGDTSLAAVVLGGRLGNLGFGCRRHALEEGLNPPGQTRLTGTVSDNGDVGLGVGSLSKGGNGVLVEVRGDRGLGRRVEGCAKTAVESDGVGGIEGDSGSINAGLLQVNDVLNLLVELVG